MDAESWKIIAQVAGIGGIALGVLLTVFRDIVRKSIFPTLTKGDGYRLMRLITLCTWSVALVGVAAWVAIQWKPSDPPPPTPSSQTSTTNTINAGDRSRNTINAPQTIP